MVMPLFIALVYPEAAFNIQMLYVVGRVLFAFGYMHYGPNSRVPGALLLDVGHLGVFWYIYRTMAVLLA